jgi:hypothetical protein
MSSIHHDIDRNMHPARRATNIAAGAIHRILTSFGSLGYAAALAGMAATPAILYAQSSADGPRVGVTDSSAAGDVDLNHPHYTFKSRADSLSWAHSRSVADRAHGFRLVVSLKDRHLWAIADEDTVLSAPVAVASGRELEFENQTWVFDMPRGVRTVLDKEADPIWQPPEWLYAETAKEYGLKLGHIVAGDPIKLDDGRLLTVKDDEVGLIQDGEFAALPTTEHIVFDNTLYVPPLGTKNRRVEGELGKYRLNLGEGFLMHGTPFKDSIGLASTHGCVRLRDEDIEWLYDNVPVGTKVYVY